MKAELTKADDTKRREIDLYLQVGYALFAAKITAVGAMRAELARAVRDAQGEVTSQRPGGAQLRIKNPSKDLLAVLRWRKEAVVRVEDSDADAVLMSFTTCLEGFLARDADACARIIRAACDVLNRELSEHGFFYSSARGRGGRLADEARACPTGSSGLLADEAAGWRAAVGA